MLSRLLLTRSRHAWPGTFAAVHDACVKDGLINPIVRLEFEVKSPVAAHLDGQNAFGFIMAIKAMADAV